MIQQQTKILWNRPLGIDCVHLGLACEQGFEDSVPGQFVMVRVGDGSAPLLRRPFSISGLLGNPDEPGGIELLVKAVGDGTRALAQMGPGALVNLIGPLGHGFRIPKKTGASTLPPAASVSRQFGFWRRNWSSGVPGRITFVFF
jgi:dihydroorotate dehydrogenase electron transfer subunit